MESSFTIVRVRGIPIGANWAWLLIVGFFTFMLGTVIFPRDYPGVTETSHWAMAVAAALLFFVTLILHEIGHAIQAQKEGMEVEGITLWLLGGVARFKGMFPSAGAEFRIAIAGPLVTLALVLILRPAAWLLDNVGAPLEVAGVVDYLGIINIIILVFNMLPALPLDGGRVLRSILWKRRGSFLAATESSASLTKFFAGALIAFAVLVLLTGGGIVGVFYAIIGWFLLQASQGELQFAQLRQSLRHRTIGDLMTPDPEWVDPYRSIGSFIEDVAHTRGHSTYPVLDRGVVQGLISLRMAAQVPAEQRSTVLVRDVMLSGDRLPTIGVDGDVTDVVGVLQEPPGRAVVMEDGRMVGILSASDVARTVEIEQLRAPVPGTVRRRPRRLRWVVVAAAGILAAGYFINPPVVVVAPGEAFDVTADIRIEGLDAREVSGEYLLTSVSVQQPNGFGFVAALVAGRDVIAIQSIIPRGVDPDEFFEQQRRLFEEAQTIAAGAAARAAGMEVEITGGGAGVLRVEEGFPAEGILEPGDVIVAVDGRPIQLAPDVTEVIRSRPAGSSFDVEVVRAGSNRTFQVSSQPGPEGIPLIGVSIETRDFSVELPFEVTFRERAIGGPSAGLAYALAVYDLITEEDVAQGRTIAATGTVDLQGRVGLVGGVAEKAVAAADQEAVLFLVPGPEVEQARGADLEVRGVDSLEDALAVLNG
jgi:PDZ domain-containing secreted protein/Zn-dependent protease/predicted transcriptional regulator